MSSTYVIVIRVIQGLVSGLAFPSVYNLFRVWTGLEERATLMSVVFSAVAGATVVNFPLASLLCKSGLDGGWPMVFYVPGNQICPYAITMYQNVLLCDRSYRIAVVSGLSTSCFWSPRQASENNAE